MRLKILILGICCSLTFAASVLSFQNSQKSDEHTKWIADSLKKMQTIKVGSTRAELLQVFKTEGGLSTGLRRTYVFRECPLIKVDVEFDAVGRPARDEDGRSTLEDSDKDVVKSISKPYLNWSVTD